MQDASIANFAGGLTDNFIDCSSDKYQAADNLLITVSDKLRSRPGSDLYDTDNGQLPTGDKRVSGILEINDVYMFMSETNLFYHDTAYNEITGPSGNDAFPLGDEDGIFSWGKWNNTLIMGYDDYTNNYFNLPIKVYKDQDDEWQVRTAGLPKMEDITATPTVTAVSDAPNGYIYKFCYYTKYYVGTVEFQDWGPFTLVSASVDEEDLSANTVSLESIPVLTNSSGSTNYNTGETIPGVDGQVVTMTSASPGVVTLEDHGKETGDAVQFTTTGVLPTLILTTGFYYIIKIDDDTFNLATTYANAIAETKIDTSTGTQSGIHTCYFINIYVKIFRTQLNGSDFTLLATLANGEEEYSDSALDTAIVDNQSPYTLGGVLDNDQPLPAKYVHVVNGIGYYGHVKEGDEVLSNRLMQSIKNDPDSVPLTSYIDLEDNIKGISSYLDRVLVLCESKIYRVDGYLDEVGGGELAYQSLDPFAGCLSHSSIVQIPQGIVWAGVDGFYFTDGYTVVKITDELNDTYKALTQITLQKRRFYGSYDSVNKRVYWSVQEGVGATDDINKSYILDMRNFAKIISSAGPFTTASNEDAYAPTSCFFIGGNLLRGDRRGYVLLHDSSLLNDPLIDTSKFTTNWDKQTIVYDYKSPASSLGSLKYRKYVPTIIFDAFSESNLSVQIISNNDMGRLIDDLKPIRNRDAVLWGTDTVLWGDDSVSWDNKRLIEEKRRMKARSLRCSYKQIEITNANVAITNSDTLGNASVDSTEITLVDGTFDWPVFSLGHYLEFNGEGHKYPIMSTTTTTMTINDSYREEITISEASVGYVTLADHGKETGDIVSFSTGGTLPTNISSGVNYYVISATSSTYALATSLANAEAGIKIDTSGSVSAGQAYQNSLNNGEMEFVMFGYPKDEILHLMSYTLYYDILGLTQTSFDAQGVGANE